MRARAARSFSKFEFRYCCRSPAAVVLVVILHAAETEEEQQKKQQQKVKTHDERAGKAHCETLTLINSNSKSNNKLWDAASVVVVAVAAAYSYSS